MWLIGFYIPSYIFREKGGMEAERAERERWITREQQKIMESVNGKATAVPRNGNILVIN